MRLARTLVQGAGDDHIKLVLDLGQLLGPLLARDARERRVERMPELLVLFLDQVVLGEVVAEVAAQIENVVDLRAVAARVLDPSEKEPIQLDEGRERFVEVPGQIGADIGGLGGEGVFQGAAEIGRGWVLLQGKSCNF